MNPPHPSVSAESGPLEALLDRVPAIRHRLPPAARTALAALVALNVAIVVWYICVGYRYSIHSDAAVKNILAGEIYETGRYFPPDFNFVNFDLWVWYGHTYILPLLPFFPNTFALHAVSGLVSFALILCGTWWLAGLLTPMRWLRIAALALITAAFSPVMADNLYGQVSYGAMFYWTCFLVVLAWRGVSPQTRRRGAWLAAFGTMVALLYWANPQRATISFGVPLVLALASHGFGAWWAEGRTAPALRRSATVFGILAGASIVGVILHIWIVKSVHNVGGTGTALWLPFQQMARNAGDTVFGLVAMLGGLPPPSGFVARPAGLYEALRLMAAGAVLVLLPWALRRALVNVRPATRFVGYFTTALALSVLFIQVATSVPEMSDPIQSTRYLVPSLLLGTLMLLMAVAEERQRWLRRLAGGAALALLATSAYSAMVASEPAFSYSMRIAEFLKRNDLHYGYAGYWNSAVVTLHTGGDVKVRQILLVDGLPMPYRHLSSDRWYRPDAWKDQTFLMIHPTEAPSLDLAKLTRLAGPPVRTLEVEGVKVYVFDHNIARDIAGWAR